MRKANLITLVSVMFFLTLSRFCFASDLLHRTWQVEGVTREALLYIPPASGKKRPLVFIFHGHGGSMQKSAMTYPLAELWPEAITVWPQGLNTPGGLTDPEGRRPGWQTRSGVLGDRDLRFFDAMLATLREEYRIDDSRIYAGGFSNGGAFTFLLWAVRGDEFAAFAPMGAIAPPDMIRLLVPKPVFFAGGTRDRLVRFAWQESMFEIIRKVNKCRDEAEQADPDRPLHRKYASAIAMPTESFFYPGGHVLAPEASKLMVGFFRKIARPR